MKFMKLGLLAAGAMALPAAANSADDIINTGLLTLQDGPSSWTEAFADGTSSIKFNYRFEEVDVDGVDRKAHASTLATTIGYRTATYKGIQAFAQFEDTSVIGGEGYFSSGGRPGVGDPEGSNLNQAYITYALSNSTVKFGRQELVLDNARFVGNVGWRQNNQSYDALAWVSGDSLPVNVVYAYVDNVHNIFNGATHTKSHVLNVSKDIDGVGKATAYVYALDLLGTSTASTMTMGARLDGAFEVSGDMSLDYLLEFATQSDYADNSMDIDADYYRFEVGTDLGSFNLNIGQESLGSDDGAIGFATPLATKHAHNGWADQFLGTPVDGLEDFFFSAGTKVSGVALKAIFHDFSSDFGSTDYGTELDFVAKYKHNANLTYGFKYADFSADSSGGMADTNKMWFWVTWAP